MIPANISRQVILNKQDRQILATFLKLKSLSKSSVLTYQKKLSDKISISWNTFKKRLNLLIEQGYCEYKKGKIYLISWEQIREKFYLKNLNFYKAYLHDNIEHKLIELSIRDNFKKQRYAIERAKKLYKECACSVEEIEQINQFIPEVITLSQKTLAGWLGSMNYQLAQYYLYGMQKNNILVNVPQKPEFIYQDKKTKRKFYKWKVNLIEFLPL